MKISVCYRRPGSEEETHYGPISSVRSFDSYMDKDGVTEEKIIERTKECNDDAGYERFKIVEVDDEVGELFSFLLGDRKYKTLKEIDDFCDELEDIDSTLSGLARDVFDASEAIENMKNKLKETLERFEKK